MKVARQELLALSEVVAALGPYHADLVLIGGWAHRLFALHPLARPREWEPLRTNDVDFAVDAGLTERERPLSAFLEGAGFKADMKSIHTRPPLTRYRRADLLVEFVADQKGSATTRKGEPRDVASVAGITAEQLRYVYPLQLLPWSPPATAAPATLASIRVAHPVAYLFQKLLVARRRAPPKDGNDLLYIADTADVFGDHLDALARAWNELRSLIHPKHVQAFHQAGAALARPADAHRRAARTAAAIGRPRAADELAEVVRFILARVFGDTG